MSIFEASVTKLVGELPFRQRNYIWPMANPYDAEYFMRRALLEAQIAAERGEVPVGAVVVSRERIIGRAHNLTETLNDVTAHAEMQAITAAADYLGGKYLKGCSLYVTLEPCAMCAGALYWSQVQRVVYAAADPKRGYRQMGGQLHPKTEVHQGPLAEEAQALLQDFFKNRR
jgi:tRNA(adenine34) deaminase